MPYKEHLSWFILTKVETNGIWNPSQSDLFIMTETHQFCKLTSQNQSKMKWNNKGQVNNLDLLSIGETIIMPGCLSYPGLFWV